MSEPTPIQPDIQFKNRLMKAGGDTLKKCFQCGTCTVACSVSPDNNPFPRKELLWAQWGLKDRLMADPDVWLCHQCNDCSEQCPREAKPGDVLAVVRQSVIEEYATPGFLARMIASPKWLPVLLAVPAVLILVAIALTGGFSAGAEESHFLADGIFAASAEGGVAFKKPVNFDHFFAHYPIIIFFVLFTGLAFLGALSGLVRYWKAMDAAAGGSGRLDVGRLVSSAVGAVQDIFTHKKFRACESSGNRYLGHLLMFYGFAGMFVTTALAAILYYTAGYPFGLLHPVKILGNVSGLVFLGGLALVIVDRVKGDKLTPRSGYTDWLFLSVIALTVVTGVICQAARLANAAVPAYTWYFIHLVLVFFLLVYLPYSKFGHILYRTVAMTYSRYADREREAVSEEPAEPEAQPQATA
jgi:quinone-modifying oxidoreductase subunit QmoC